MVGGTLAVHVSDALPDGCFEMIGIDEGPVGEMVTLQVAPGAFDVIEFGRIAWQPLDGEPRALRQGLAGEVTGVDRTVVEDEHQRPLGTAGLRAIATVDLVEEGEEV